MKTYHVKYVAYVSIEVEAENEEQACQIGDELLEGFTGADFRECAEFTGIEEVIE